METANVTTKLEEVLTEAIDSVTGERNEDYGPPARDFARIAGMLSALFLDKCPGGFTAHDVALIQIVVKLSRIQESAHKLDHWVDIAGYAACGYQALSFPLL